MRTECKSKIKDGGILGSRCASSGIRRSIRVAAEDPSASTRGIWCRARRRPWLPKLSRLRRWISCAAFVRQASVVRGSFAPFSAVELHANGALICSTRCFARALVGRGELRSEGRSSARAPAPLQFTGPSGSEACPLSAGRDVDRRGPLWPTRIGMGQGFVNDSSRLQKNGPPLSCFRIMLPARISASVLEVPGPPSAAVQMQRSSVRPDGSVRSAAEDPPRRSRCRRSGLATISAACAFSVRVHGLARVDGRSRAEGERTASDGRRAATPCSSCTSGQRGVRPAPASWRRSTKPRARARTRPCVWSL